LKSLPHPQGREVLVVWGATRTAEEDAISAPIETQRYGVQKHPYNSALSET